MNAATISLIRLNKSVIDHLAFHAAKRGMTIALKPMANSEYWNNGGFTGYSSLAVTLTKYKGHGKWLSVSFGGFCLDPKGAIGRAMHFING
jgi:hypothetical protein